MAIIQAGSPFPLFTDKGGDPLDGGFVYFGEPDLNPEESPKTVYYDAALAIATPQPLRTSNGYITRNGAPAAIYSDGAFSMTVRDRNGALVFYSPSTFLPDGFVLSDRNPKDVSALLADTSLTYAAGQTGTVAAGDIIRTLAEGFSYEVAASDATDHHVTTAGGVKLYVLPGETGSVNVDQFGAVGDGVTSDSAAFQTAVSNFAEIRLSAKTYALATKVIIPRNRKLSGVSEFETVVLCTGDNSAFESDESVIGSLVRNIIIERMYIQKETPTSTTGVFGVLLKGTTNNSWGCRISDVVVSGFYDGVFISRPIMSEFTNIDSFSNFNDGLVFEGAGTSVTAANIWGRVNGRDGIHFRGDIAYSAFNGCGADDNVRHGWAMQSTISDTVIANTISLNGCGAESNGGDGFWLEAAENISFSACFSFANAGSGFGLFGVRGVTLFSCRTLTNTGYGIETGATSNGKLPSTVSSIGGTFSGDTLGRISDATVVSDMLSPEVNQFNIARFVNGRIGLKVNDTTVFDANRVLQNLGRGSHTVQTQKFEVTYTDIANTFTIGDYILPVQIPNNSYMTDVAMRLDAEFSGGGVLTATLEFGDSGSSYNNFMPATNVFTGAGIGYKNVNVSDRGSRFYDSVNNTTLRPPVLTGDRQVVARLRATGANTDQLTQGAATLWVSYITLPQV